MPKGIPNKRYTPEFKMQVVEAVIQDGLSYQETARIYEVQGHGRIQSWERIYLEEGPEGLAVERCGGAKSKTKMARIPKQRNMQQIYKKRTWKKHSQARYLMCSVQFPAFVLQL